MVGVTCQQQNNGYCIMSNSSSGQALFVANNLALDFINTSYGTDHRHCDCLVDDDSVLAWLALAQSVSEPVEVTPAGLYELARDFRSSARAAVVAAAAGEPADIGLINEVLEAGRYSKALVWDADRQVFVMKEYRRNDDAASLLQPVAQALADLLVHEDLQLVRQCEAHDCTLFFHDQTKSHRRRWCSMASCGNRVKAAAHRARKEKR